MRQIKGTDEHVKTDDFYSEMMEKLEKATASHQQLKAERRELLEICGKIENLFSCLLIAAPETQSASSHFYTISIRELFDRLAAITKAEKDQAPGEPQKTRVKKIECPECCGLGEIPDYTGESIECPVCEGSGEVAVINKGAE